MTSKIRWQQRWSTNLPVCQHPAQHAANWFNNPNARPAWVQRLTVLPLSAYAYQGAVSLVLAVYEERASGGRWDRPELHRLLDRLGTGDVLTVWKLDRLSRSLKDLLLILDKVEKAGAGFRSLIENIDSTTASGRMMMQMLGAFAEFERAIVRERTQAGLRSVRA